MLPVFRKVAIARLKPVGFIGCEFRRHDRKAHRLFLEQGHTFGLVKHAVEFVRRAMLRRRRRKFHRFRAAAPPQIRMHHIALDGAGRYNRHLDHEIVEFTWVQPRQHVHLRPAFHLEHSDGIGPCTTCRKLPGLRVALCPALEARFFMRAISSKALRIQVSIPSANTSTFMMPKRVDVVFVPLNEIAVFHRRRADRNNRVQPVLRQHKSADML